MSRTYRRRGERHDYDWVLGGIPAGPTVRWSYSESTRVQRKADARLRVRFIVRARAK